MIFPIILHIAEREIDHVERIEVQYILDKLKC